MTTCSIFRLRDITDRLLKTSFNDTTKRPMFLPVDWRSDLELDERKCFVSNRIERLVNTRFPFRRDPKFDSELLGTHSTILQRKFDGPDVLRESCARIEGKPIQLVVCFA